MASDFAKALEAEINALEADLQRDPRYVKLAELQRVRALYSGGHAPAHASPASSRFFANASAPMDFNPAKRRSGSPERQAILAKARAYLEGRAFPTPTIEIYEAIKGEVDIPGRVPRNNLSAMLSNSGEFISHGRVGWMLASRNPEAPGDLLTRSAPEASNSSPASPAGEPDDVRPVDPVPGGGT